MNGLQKDAAEKLCRTLTPEQTRAFIEFVQMFEGDIDYLSERITDLEEELNLLINPERQKKKRPVSRLKIVKKADG